MKNLSFSLDKKSDLKILRILIPYIWPKDKPRLKIQVVAALSCLILSKVVNVYMPFLYKRSIDALDGLSEGITLFSLPILLIFAYGASRIGALLFGELRDAIFATVEQGAIRTIALNVFAYLHSLSLRFHLDRKTGALSRIIERGVKGIETVFRFMLFNILPIFLEMIFVSFLLWRLYDIRYMNVTLVTLLLYIAATIFLTEWRIAFVRSMNASENESNAKAIDSLLNYETVKYFGNEDHEIARYDLSLQHYEKAAIKSKRSLALLNIIQGIIIATGLVVLMSMAAFEVNHQKMTLGDFVLVNTYLIQLYLPLNLFGFAYREIKLSLVSMEQMFALFQETQEIKDPVSPKIPVLKEGHIAFKKVSFAYNPDRQILKNISFEVPAGQTCAIVGPTGSGKSTLARLLFRFYDVTEGIIEIDGCPVTAIPQKVLHQAIGVVPQDTVLFNDTIYYNIAYGNPQASQSQVIEAAQQARLHDFITRLPQGYETLVGERGLKLSGGEKQRVAIARTFLKRPLIFLFDEATSALDSHTEKEIQESLKTLSKSHTTLIIAHRLSTIVEADLILVLDQGEIKEQGTHHDLLKQNGLYAHLWQKQQKEQNL